MIRPLTFLLLLLLTSFSFSQETFKTMFYNLLNFPLQEPINRIQYLDFILNDVQPDIFMVCELNSIDGANSILNSLQNINTNYAMASFVLNSSDDSIGDQNDLQNLIYFDSSKFILESQDQITTLFRDFNYYRLKLNTIEQATNPLYLDVFVCHLKASDGTENENIRLQMVNDLQSYLNNSANNFDTNSYIMLAGDFNVYRSSEPAFQELIDPTNNITFTDPVNRIGNWHTNPSFIDVFTQSTRTTSSLGGSSGGFDDRFDFIMMSENMINDSQLYYSSNSYQVYGNNNNPSCFNAEINSSSCSGTQYSSTIRDALYFFSDHLPVRLDLETNQSLSNNEFLEHSPITFINGNYIAEELKLKVNFNLISARFITIYNTLGQKVERIAVDSSDIISKDVSHLPNGIYLITINDNNIGRSLKFIKGN